MQDYRVDVNFHGIASVVLEAESEEDAMNKAEALLEGSNFPRMKLEDAEVSLELNGADANFCEIWDRSGGSW